MPTTKSELDGRSRSGEAPFCVARTRLRRPHRAVRWTGTATAVALLAAGAWAGSHQAPDAMVLQAMSVNAGEDPQPQTANANTNADADAAASAEAEADEQDAAALEAQVRTDVPTEVVPAASIAALGVPRSSETTTQAATAGSSIRVSPAIRARLAAEERASRAADRAMLGADAGFARPVEGAHFTSGFGRRWGRMHAGLDFAGPVGLQIRAVAAGTVTIAEEQSGYGNLLEVQHADGSFSRYAHLSRIRVKVGDEVEAAQIIAALGNTGRSTGPHLHFEIRTPAGTPINPQPWLRERGVLPIDTEPEPAHD